MFRNLIKAVFLILLCSLGSLAIGYLFYGSRIFNVEYPLFQFVASGLFSGIFVAAALTTRPPWRFIIWALAYLLMLTMTRSNTPGLLIRDAILVATLILAVQVSLASGRFFPRVVIGKFLVWGAVFALGHLAAMLVLGLMNPGSLAWEPVLMAVRIGGLVGVGVGLGYEVMTLIGFRST